MLTQLQHNIAAQQCHAGHLKYTTHLPISEPGTFGGLGHSDRSDRSGCSDLYRPFSAVGIEARASGLLVLLCCASAADDFNQQCLNQSQGGFMTELRAPAVNQGKATCIPRDDPWPDSGEMD